MDFIAIDDEMRLVAKNESARRNPNIKHHFEVDHLSPQERDEVGFLGEFACGKYFGMDWRENIRDNYLTIDNFDLVYKGMKIDVKTETLSQSYADRILNKTITDDGLYGRRLVNENQLPLLKKYDIVIFGMLIRPDFDKWYPIGFLEASIIIQNYPPQKIRPDGGIYPDSAAAVRTSALKPLSLLF